MKHFGWLVILTFVVLSASSLLVSFLDAKSASNVVQEAYSDLQDHYNARTNLASQINVILLANLDSKDKKLICFGNSISQLKSANTIPKMWEANGSFEKSLFLLLPVIANNPELKSNLEFKELMRKLSVEQCKVADDIKYYNSWAWRYNESLFGIFSRKKEIFLTFTDIHKEFTSVLYTYYQYNPKLASIKP
jgi:LemA protein